MSPEELHRLIEEYRDGAISVDDARRLAEAIRADAGIAGQVHRELAFTGHLGQSLDASDDEAFVRSFTERVSAERGGDAFRVEFEKRTSSRSSRRIVARRPSLAPFVVAAGFLLAILAAVAWQSKQPAPATGIVKQTPPPAPPEEPKPEPQPAPPAPPEPPKPPEPKPEVKPEPRPDPAPKPEEPKQPDPVKPPDEPKPAPPVKPVDVTRTITVAVLDRVEGEVFVVVDGERRAGKAGQEMPPGVRLSTGLGRSSASVLFPDGSRLALGADATVREISKSPKGTRVELTVGTITADVAKQLGDQSLTFVTPHGEARVIGTVLRLVVDATSTRLEVKEGKVQLTREGKQVVVGAGQYAVAGPRQTMSQRSISPDEIVLWAQHAKLTGTEWSLLRDPQSWSSVNVVLEAGPTPFKVVDHVETRPSYATFTFFAPADKEYRIWMRVTSQEKGDPWLRDMVTIEPTRATMNQKSPFFGAAVTNAYVVTGAATTPGFTWIGCSGEEARANLPPITVKFNETGFQNIRLYVGHPWVRVDAIWLSATQKTRPTAKTLPPAEK